jgi:hypothetical protein
VAVVLEDKEMRRKRKTRRRVKPKRMGWKRRR